VDEFPVRGDGEQPGDDWALEGLRPLRGSAAFLARTQGAEVRRLRMETHLRRSGFLATAAAALALPAGAATSVLPAVLDGGRFFATPRVARDGAVMRLWLDTDGSGFVFSESVQRWGLATIADPNSAARRWTRLPEFLATASIPMPAGFEGRLPIFTRDAIDRADPILRGFDGQLGASWFQNRTWTFDYRGQRLTLRGRVVDADGVRMPVSFARGRDGRRLDGRQYPHLGTVVDGTARTMSFDTAASVALSESGRARLHEPLPPVRATSFVRRAVFDAWRGAHPDWPTLDDVSVIPQVAAIRVPSVRLGALDLGPVWFTTRPDDDVFGGTASIDAKLGANAFAGRIVTLDYPRALLAIR
jgi:hypothetical protein